jgi:hypothetical protein
MQSGGIDRKQLGGIERRQSGGIERRQSGGIERRQSIESAGTTASENGHLTDGLEADAGTIDAPAGANTESNPPTNT